MKVWILYERYFHSFDIVADEHTSIVSVHSSEESAYCKMEELNAASEDEYISYYYAEHEVVS